MKNIIISGYYGFGNTGDEAILSSMLKQIKDKVSDCNIIVISGDVEETKRLHKVDAINRYDFVAIGHNIEKCCLVILGGGGLFQDNHKIDISNIFTQPGYGTASYVIVPLIAKMHNKPVIYYSQGIGPLFSKESKTFVSFASDVADIITVRDNGSRDLLIEIGAQPSKIILSADPAINLEIISPERIENIFNVEKISSANIICVCLREWIDKSLEENYKIALSEGLDNFSNNNDCNLVFVPFQQREYGNDLKISKEVIEKMENKDKCHILKGSYSPQEIAGIISKSRLMIGMRYHSIIFSVISKIPFVALSYDPKVINLVKELGLEEYCIDINSINSKDIESVAIKALENKEKIQKILELSIIDMRNRLEFSSGIIKKFIEDSNDGFMIDIPIVERLGLLNMTYIYCQLKEKDNLISDIRSQLKDKDNIISDIKSDVEIKNVVITKLQGTILQRENSISWRFSQRYDRYIGYDSKFTRLLINILNFSNKERNIVKNVIDVSINEGIKGLIRRLGSKMAKPYVPYAFNPYSKLRLLKPIDIVVVDNDYTDKIEDIRNKFKFSMVIPVKNEEIDIQDLLHSIDVQIFRPDELIIVDGGSKDKTVELIEQYKNNGKLNIKLIKETSGSLSLHRNIGIKNTIHENILLLDAGNSIDPNYCLNFIGILAENPDADLVGGICYPKKDNYWANKLIWNWSKIDFREFIPSAKSMLIKKRLALKFGGFPEFLRYTGEDTLFSIMYRKNSQKWIINKSTYVHWDSPSLKEDAIRKAYLYGKGDGESGIGDYKFYERVIDSIKGINIKFDDPIEEFGFKGYLDGRKDRVKILVDQKKIRGNVLILSGIPLTDSGGGQRGTQIALELMKLDYKVTFCNVYPSFEKGEKVFLDIEHHLLELYYFQDFQLEDYIKRHSCILDNTVIILEFPHPDFIPIIKKIKSIRPDIKIIYDCVDNWDSSLGWVWYSKEKEMEIIELSDSLTASAKTLVNRLKAMTKKEINLIPNAVNTRLFNSSLKYDKPIDLPDGKPIIMYIGALWGEWFDWELLKYLANGLKDTNIILIGSVPNDNEKYLELKEYENIFFLGLKNQCELPKYLSYANVCIIPFKYDEKIIKYTNPLKIYEYLAMKKSVVSIYMNELDGIPNVLLSNDHSSFLKNIDNALSMSIDKNLKEYIENNSWINRVNMLTRIIEGYAQK